MALLPGTLAAQGCVVRLEAGSPAAPCGTATGETPRWMGHAATLGANALLGGVTAGVARRVQGGSFREGFVRGAAGGSVTYAGKRVAAADFPGAGLLGREVAAVGSSVVANAAEGRGVLERVALPVGPVRVYVDRSGSARPLHAKLDLPGAVELARAVAGSTSSVDWGWTLSAGTPVFVEREDRSWLGRASAGVVTLLDRDLPSPDGREQMRAVLRHEQVHVAQYDFTAIAWGEPLERHLLEGTAVGRTVGRYVDLGLHVAVWGGLRLLYPSSEGPWEREARFLVP